MSKTLFSQHFLQYVQYEFFVVKLGFRRTTQDDVNAPKIPSKLCVLLCMFCFCSSCFRELFKVRQWVVQIIEVLVRLFRQLGLVRHLPSPCTNPWQRLSEQHPDISTCWVYIIGIISEKFNIHF